MDTSKLTYKERVKAFAQAKEKEKQIKEIIKNLQVDLYRDHMEIGSDTLGTNEIGKSTVVYKTVLIPDFEATKKLAPIDENIDQVKSQLLALQEERESKLQELKIEGLVKEDKQFSYIKYTKPKS